MQEKQNANTNEKRLIPNSADADSPNQEKIYSQLEDAALKAALQFFGEELFPYLGIDEKPIAILPTEMVHLEIKKMYEDFNFLMKDNSWIHIEFESDSITRKDLRRFREYEAVTSNTYGVDVTTVVVCSAKTKHPMSELKVGLNTYKVKAVRLKDTNADLILKKLSETENSQIEKDDLVPLVLTPLMGGEIPEKERILQSFTWLNNQYQNVSKEELDKMQAVLYALAAKTLKNKDLEEIKEAISMTILGQMLLADGIKKGKEEGKKEGIQQCKTAWKLSAQGESPEAISQKLQISLEEVLEILED
ncbi:hypothetical protein NXH76_02545 [Blautia schinkii]|nr:hypothetical protein [Blautia schinkii]